MSQMSRDSRKYSSLPDAARLSWSRANTDWPTRTSFAASFIWRVLHGGSLFRPLWGLKVIISSGMQCTFSQILSWYVPKLITKGSTLIASTFFLGFMAVVKVRPNFWADAIVPKCELRLSLSFAWKLWSKEGEKLGSDFCGWGGVATKVAATARSKRKKARLSNE